MSVAINAQKIRHVFFATRPAFLSVSFVAVLLGWATAHANGIALHPTHALLTLVFALCAHASANVLNDYYDALNGADTANEERLFPFTGGSRSIQDGWFTPRQMAILGGSLLGVVILAGLLLIYQLPSQSSSGLLGIGVLGLWLGWTYSAPPLALASRGLGEWVVTVVWLLVIIGADYVQRGAYAAFPVVAGLSYALLLANLLYINQFPDATSDAQVGKRTLVVRWGRRHARWGYLMLGLLAYLWLLACIWVNALPQVALLAMLSAPLTLHGAYGLWQYAERPQYLKPAIRFTIAAVLTHGLLLIAALAYF